MTQLVIDNTFYRIVHSGPQVKWYGADRHETEKAEMENLENWDWGKQQILINYHGNQLFVNSNTVNNEEMHQLY